MDWAQIFLVVGVHDLITPFEFSDDRFRGFWLADGQSLSFPIDFEGRPYNTHTIVWGVIWAYVDYTRVPTLYLIHRVRKSAPFDFSWYLW